MAELPQALVREIITALNQLPNQSYQHEGERQTTYKLVSRIEQALSPRT